MLNRIYIESKLTSTLANALSSAERLCSMTLRYSLHERRLTDPEANDGYMPSIGKVIFQDIDGVRSWRSYLAEPAICSRNIHLASSSHVQTAVLPFYE